MPSSLVGMFKTLSLSKAVKRYLFPWRITYSSNIIGDKISDAAKIEGKDPKAEMSQYVVGHDKKKKFFYINLNEESSTQPKAVAVLEYKWIRPGLVDLFHTEVPPEFRGQGIAKVLAEVALDSFCEQGAQIRPTCTYLQKYLRENPLPRYNDHVDHDFL